MPYKISPKSTLSFDFTKYLIQINAMAVNPTVDYFKTLFSILLTTKNKYYYCII
jgi:hypothetical protein